MDVVLPRSLDEALELASGTPTTVPIAGGTDVMVGLNMDLARPETLMDVSRLPELQEIRREDGSVFLGAGVTYTRIMRELPDLTALVQASRSVGSPQIRNRGTVGGNLGTASRPGMPCRCSPPGTRRSYSGAPGVRRVRSPGMRSSWV